MPQLGPIFVVVNPTAAYGKTSMRWSAIQDAMRAQGLEFTAALTERRGHAAELARQAAEQGFRLIVAVGGEGTLFEMANGLMAATGAVDPAIALGTLPSGTGSDFARFLGLPRDATEAAARLVGDKTITIDLGYLECRRLAPPGEEADPDAPLIKRYFMNVAGLGFDGEVIERVERGAKGTKAIGGTIPYLSNLFASLLAYRNKNFTITYDGRPLAGRFNSVVCANGAYFGGGMFIAPKSKVDDGLFDLVLLGDLTKPEIVVTLPRLYKGTHLTHPKVTLLHAKEVRVDSQERALVQADGELVGMGPAVFRIIPGALRVKV
jgi:diacylglycerol kinase (ATP)